MEARAAEAEQDLTGTAHTASGAGGEFSPSVEVAPWTKPGNNHCAAGDLAGRVTGRALELTLATLERHGNHLSVAHRDALAQTVGLFTGIASGQLRGRYVVDLATGLGKTTAVVCWAKAVVEAGARWSLAICASRVEELCDIYRDLTSGPSRVSEDLVGLWHSLDQATRPSTFPKGPEDCYCERQILLLTHQRVRQGPTVEERLRFRGATRDLVVYDESLLTTRPLDANHSELLGQVERVLATLNYQGEVAGALDRFAAVLREEANRQEKGEPPRLIVPFADPSQENLAAAVERVLGREAALFELTNGLPRPLRLLVVRNNLRDATLVRSEVTVPDGLDRMAVLDASFPVRSLLHRAGDSLPEEHQGIRLVPRRPRGSPLVKRYDHLTVRWMQTKRSGRELAKKDMRHGVEGSSILAELVAVVEAIPADEAVLVWTFLRTSNKWPDFPGLTEKALRQAGIDTAATIEAGGEPRRRIVVETFGRETASNAYAYCRNVVLLGCLEPSPQALAGQFVAESRNLLVQVPADTLDDLIRGEVYHRVYQAISRAACRRVSMDDQGRTQAEVTNVWLMSRHPHLRHDLGKVLPGARWEDWTSGIDEDALIGKTVRAAAKLEELLDEYEAQGVTKVGLKKPKGQVMKVVGHISNETFQIARSRAIEGRPWRLERQSLVYLGTKDTAQDDNPA